MPSWHVFCVSHASFGGSRPVGVLKMIARAFGAETRMDNDVSVPVGVTNERLLAWVRQMRRLCKPDSVHWVDGSVEEYDRLCAQMVERGTFTRLNPEKRPNSYLARSHPSDVARVEERTFVCSLSKDDAGPTNNWAPPGEMRAKLHSLFDGCMRGRGLPNKPHLAIDAQDLRHLGFEFGVAAFHVVADLVRLDLLLIEDVPHRALSQLGKASVPRCRPMLSRMAGEQSRRPQFVGIAEFLGLAAGEVHNPCLGLGGDRRLPAGPQARRLNARAERSTKGSNIQ